VKGSSTGIAFRARVLAAFAAAFVTGSVLVFAAAAIAGAVLRIAGISMAARTASAAAVFFVLAALDVIAIRKKTYCAIGRRRQTPQWLGRRFGPTATAAVWGFDTGLVVTTFRVAAITWAALSMAALELAPWWTGLAYGLGFAIPMLILLVARTADSDSLHRSLRMRPILQSCSAVALIAGAVYLLA